MGINTAQVELIGSYIEVKYKRPVGHSNTESSPKGVRGERDQVCDSNRVTQHQVGVGGWF